MMTEKLYGTDYSDSTKRRGDFSEFEHFISSKKRHIGNKGTNHIIQRVTEDWKLDVSVAQEMSKLIKLVVRDYIQFWFVNVSKRTDFATDVEEILTYAICALVRRGSDFINPYMFVGDKVCDILVRTMTLFRCACQKVRKEHPNVDKSSRQFQMLVANEFRNDGHLHIALMATCGSEDEEKSDELVGEGGHNSSSGNGNGGSSRSETFKQDMLHASTASDNSASELSMEEFFAADRLASIESEYSFYVGGFLTKFLMDGKEENSKAGRHLFTEILSNILLGSIYWLCTPSSVYFYVHMAVMSMRPSDGGQGAGAEGGQDSMEGQASLSVGSSSDTVAFDLHVELKDYYVGNIGAENVSSSCCMMAIEAAAAIVLREAVLEEGGGRGGGDSDQIPLPSAGHFILRQYPPSSSSSCPSLPPATDSPMQSGVFCLSYIRPPPVAGDSSGRSDASHWQLDPSPLNELEPSFALLGLQAEEVVRRFSRSMEEKEREKEGRQRVRGASQSNEEPLFPVSFSDERVGHIVFLAHTVPSSDVMCFDLVSCSHLSDLATALCPLASNDSSGSGSLDKDTDTYSDRDDGDSLGVERVVLPSPLRWGSLERLLAALRLVVPTPGLQLVRRSTPLISDSCSVSPPRSKGINEVNDNDDDNGEGDGTNRLRGLSLPGGWEELAPEREEVEVDRDSDTDSHTHADSHTHTDSHTRQREDEDQDKANERTLLLVEKNILLNHELEGAVEEYLGRKFAPENKIIQVASSDEDGKQAIRRLLEALQNVCMHGWLKKRFVTLHPMPAVALPSASASREEGGRHIASTLSKMYAKILLNASSTPLVPDDNDNAYEEYLTKSPALWLWVSHIMCHCKGKTATAPASSARAVSGPSVLSDNSMAEKKNSISQHCICLNCNDADCYVQSMDIFLDHHSHGGFSASKGVTLDSFFECILFCGLQTGRLVDVLEVLSLLIACEGDYSAVDVIVEENSNDERSEGGYIYTPSNVTAVRGLSSSPPEQRQGGRRSCFVVPADQFAPEALLRSRREGARLLGVLLPLRDHYLHFFFSGKEGRSTWTASDTSASASSSSSSQRGLGRGMLRELLLLAPSSPPPSPSPSSSTSKEKRRPSMLKSMSQKTMSAATSFLDDISRGGGGVLDRVLEATDTPPKKLPPHLTFSTNTDIIQVSNIKLETAQDKWRQKVGEGALFGSELQRRAEVAFVLRILLRDRPPMEFLESRNIIKAPSRIRAHPSSASASALLAASSSSTASTSMQSPGTSLCSLYNIEILKYEKVGGTGGQQVVVYYIDVYRRRDQLSCPVHTAEEEPARDGGGVYSVASGRRVRVYPHKCTCRKWTIRRRYTDFDALHKHLKSQLSPSLLAAFRLPQKAYVQVVQSSFFYAKRLMGLREYLRALLLGLPDMAEMHIFLAPDDDADPLPLSPAASHPHPNITPSTVTPSSSQSSGIAPSDITTTDRTSIRNMADAVSHHPEDTPSHRHSDLPQQTIHEARHRPSRKDSDTDTNAEGVVPKLSKTSSSSTADNADEHKDKEKDRDIDKEKDKAVMVDPRAIALLETRVFALVDEVLEGDAEGGGLGVMGTIKKHVVSLLCKSIGGFFNGTVVKWLQAQARPETVSEQIASLVSLVRELFWPGGVLIEFAATEEDDAAARATDLRLRTESIAMLNTMLPHILQGQGHQVVERLFFLLDNPFILKSLSYMIVDALIIDLFPELANKLSGMDSLQRR